MGKGRVIGRGQHMGNFFLWMNTFAQLVDHKRALLSDEETKTKTRTGKEGNLDKLRCRAISCVL